MSGTLLPLVWYELTFDGEQSVFWKVESVWVSESINRPCRASLEVSTEAEVDVMSVLGASALLTIQRETMNPQFFGGVVSRVDSLGELEGLTRARIHLVSTFELLLQEVDTNIWQDSSPLDIIAELLTKHFSLYLRTFEFGEVSRGLDVRDYCVQYRESVFAFICRLLEEEGISYAFVHDGEKGHEVLTLFDANEQFQSIYTESEVFESDTLAIVANNASNLSFESIRGIEWTRELTPTGSLRRDFDWRQPETLRSEELEGTDERGRSRRLYAHTGRRFVSDDLKVRARDLLAASALSGSVLRGQSNATVLRPGMRFKVARHGGGEFAGEYIVTRVQHSGQPEAGSDYLNEFECVPSGSEVRPLQTTPKPYVRGPHTALVTGEEEIHTDEHGRIQVQFSWEEEPTYGAGSSCWIRCAHSWAGAGWGAQFIPRVGMEVVVEFIEGNPDRPLVIGCAYDGTRKHPFEVPGVKTQSGWRTRSSPGSEGFNELRFEDAADREEVYLRAQRNLRSEILANESRSVGGGRSTTICADEVLEVSEGDVRVTIAKGSRSLDIAAGDDTLTIKQGGSTKKVPNGSEQLEAKEIYICAQVSLTIECGASKITMTPSEVKVESPMIKLN